MTECHKNTPFSGTSAVPPFSVEEDHVTRTNPTAPTGLITRLAKSKGANPFIDYQVSPDGNIVEKISGSILAVILALGLTLNSCCKNMTFSDVHFLSGLDKDTVLEGMLVLYSHGLISEIDFDIGFCFYRLTPDGAKVARAVASIVNKRVRMFGSKDFDPFEFVKGLSARIEGNRLIIDYDLSNEGAVE